MRRTALLALLVAACAPKPIRPAPDVELVNAAPIAAGHGLLIFKHPSPLVHPRYHLARHSVDGQLQWHRPLATRSVPEVNQPIHIHGDAALIPISSGSIVPSDSFLHIRLATGEVREWTPQGRLDGLHPDTAVLGDDQQIFVAWLRKDLEISAFDPTTGERQWTFTGDYPSRIFPRLGLTADHLLFADPEREWQTLTRADGTRQPLHTDGDSAVCDAAGRTWARKDDQLLAFGADIRSAPATFIPPALRHQWTLVDCAGTRDGEVVLAINIDVNESGLLVGIDPETLATRWTVPMYFGFTLRARDASDTWPPVLGNTVLVDQRGDTCFVARDSARVLWCTDWNALDSWYHGEDFILAGYQTSDGPDEVRLVRVHGSDGQVSAAATIHSERLRMRDIQRTHALRGDHLWFAFPESDLDHHGKLPLLVLDATTLRPVPPTPDRVDLAPLVEDALPQLATVFPQHGRPRLTGLDGIFEGYPRTVKNPWDAVFRPDDASDSTPELGDKHREILAAARKAADLPADIEVRPLAWCEDRVVGVAMQNAGNTPRWTLLKGRQDDKLPYDILTRAHDRPLTATDLDRFLLLNETKHVSSHIKPCTTRGTIDDAVWRSVTSEPRASTWTLR